MTDCDFKLSALIGRAKFFRVFCLLCCLIAIQPIALASERLPVVPKWTRFEQSFKSSVSYPTPLQSCTLTVLFTSPTGETNVVQGFWDGGKIWRVRFSPDQAGQWTYQTSCSDPANRGLQKMSGAFLCTAPLGDGRFNQHGPVRLARDRRHFEHQDGTPFLWLADTVWNGPRLATPKDWTFYAEVRANQRFTAAQWSVAPGADSEHQVAFKGRTRIMPNPDFFKRLDAKVETLNRAGLLSIIAPLWNVDQQSVESLPEDQLVLLMRYVVARWGAYNVAWLLNCDGAEQSAALWKRVGRAAFPANSRAPSVLYITEVPDDLKEFNDPDWPDALGFQTAANGKTPNLPLINIVSPSENSLVPGSDRRVNADDVRRAIWSNAAAGSGGISYSAGAVANWDSVVDRKQRGDLPLWHKSLFLPGAKQMAVVSAVFDSIPFWRLNSAPAALASKSKDNFTVAAQTDTKDMSVFYVHEEPSVQLSLKALPPSPLLSWINPRTGVTTSGVAVVGRRAVTIPTPGPGDWVLVIKTRTR